MTSRGTAKLGWLTQITCKDQNDNTNTTNTYQERAVSTGVSHHGKPGSSRRKLPPLEVRSKRTSKQRLSSSSSYEDENCSGKHPSNGVPKSVGQTNEVHGRNADDDISESTFPAAKRTSKQRLSSSSSYEDENCSGKHPSNGVLKSVGQTNEVHGRNADDDISAESTFPAVARTIQMASSWLKKSRKTSQQPRVDSFLDRLEMFGPSVPTLGGNMEPPQDVATHKHWVVNPSGRLLFGWMVIVALAVLYNLIFIIARQCFHELHNSYMVLWFVLDYICDIIYGLDICCQFRTVLLMSFLYGRIVYRVWLQPATQGTNVGIAVKTTTRSGPS
ncbi:hypothetical protein QZH41_006664 [Actinostola sp. cb2023]|nr:hypothetical protein QZH41_006664 [Actinostola sp. cb2023]